METLFSVRDDSLSINDIHIVAKGVLSIDGRVPQEVMVYQDEQGKYMHHTYIVSPAPLPGCFMSLAGCIADLKDMLKWEHGQDVADSVKMTFLD